MSIFYQTLTAADVAYFLQVDRKTIVDWIDKGYMRCVKHGRKGIKYRLSWRAVKDFMRNHKDKWNAARLEINPLEYKIKVGWFEKKKRNDKNKLRENLTWKAWEDNILIELYNQDRQQCYQILKRSKRATIVRACRLRKKGLIA